MNPFLSLFLSLLLIFASGSGCDFRKEKVYSKSEAELEFIRICQEEYHWDVTTRFAGNTLWVYIPYEKDMFRYKANKFPQMSNCVVGYVNGEFSEGRFRFEYQISPLFRTEKDRGYTSSTVDEVSEDFHNLLNTIYRVYFNSREQPGFYVIVMADIANGVEIIYTIYNQDLRKIYNNAIAMEEYYKRIVQKINGGISIIGDKTGRHLAYKEVRLPDFLTDQITQRIRIKFTDSDTDFNLCSVPEEEIFNIISYSMSTYGFEDFLSVVLSNIAKGTQTTKTRWDLKTIEAAKES